MKPNGMTQYAATFTIDCRIAVATDRINDSRLRAPRPDPLITVATTFGRLQLKWELAPR